MEDWQKLFRRRIADRVATWESRNLDAFLNNESFRQFGRYIEVLFMAQSKPVVKTFYRQGLSVLLIKDNGEGAHFLPWVRSRMGFLWKAKRKDSGIRGLDRTLKSNLLIDIEQEVRLNANQKKKELIFDRESDTSFLKIEEFNLFLQQFPPGIAKIGSASSLGSAEAAQELLGLVSQINIASPLPKTSPPPPPSLLRKTNDRLGGGRLLPMAKQAPLSLKKGLLPPLAIRLKEPSQTENESLSKMSHISMGSSRSLSKKADNQRQAQLDNLQKDPLDSPLRVYPVRVLGSNFPSFEIRQLPDPNKMRENLQKFEDIRHRFATPDPAPQPRALKPGKSCMELVRVKLATRPRRGTSLTPADFWRLR